MRSSRVLAGMSLLCLLAGCGGRSPLVGPWAVDLQATVEQARRDGIPAQSAPQIRSVYADGRIEITDQAIVSRVAGMPDAVSRNYRVLDERDGCYRLAINGTAGTHAYCLRGRHLLVHDPATPLVVVYQREQD